MEITLIRHTKVNVEPGICYGFTDVGLAASFSEEAKEVCRQITGEKFDTVYSSPLSRCRKLAAACGFPAPNTDNRLKELNCGTWEMQRWTEITDPAINDWYDNWLHLPAGGGESFLDQYQRVAAFLDEIKQQDHQHAAIFTHSGVLRCALVYIGKIKFNEAFIPEIRYGEILRMTI